VSHGEDFALGFIDTEHSLLLSVIVENDVRLRLNIVDTPGYGDQINNENWSVALPSPFSPLPTQTPPSAAGTRSSSTSRTSTARTSARS
jgi:hypothetical protein